MLDGLDAFVGRTRDTERIVELLGDGARLVTLTGPGGLGKTRLARHVAAAQPLFDEVAVVELGPVEELALVAGHIAQTVGGGQRITAGPEGWDQLASLLTERRMLLVLDNCEHVLPVDDGEIGVDDLVARLLTGAPRLTCLATSRHPLRVRGEHEYPLEALTAPDPAAGSAGESAALELFAARARAADPTFDLDAGDNRAAAARLVHRLGGVPLFVEQVASRVGLVGTVAELEDRFEGGTYRKVAHSVMQWSWEAASPDERLLWARLSVFAGGWDLDAAEEVAGEGLDEVDVLMDSLRRQALITRSTSAVGPLRFRMLPPLREWVRHRLDAAELDAVLQRWRAWVQRLVTTAAEQAHGHRGQVTLEAVRRELSNVRAALMGCRTAEDAEWGLPVAVTLANARVPFVSGNLSEWGRWHLERLRGLYPRRDQVWVSALASEAWVAVCQGDPHAAELLQHARETAEELGDPVVTVDYARAVASTFGTGDEDGGALWASVLDRLRQDPEIPETHAELGLASMWRAIHAALYVEADQAAEIVETFREECRQQTSRHLRSWGDWSWAVLCLRRGDLKAAAQALREAVLVQQREQDYWGLPWSLVLALLLLSQRGQHRDAARVLGAVDTVMARTEIDHRRLRGLGEGVSEADRAARAALPPAVYAREHAHGAALDFERACALPLDVLSDEQQGAAAQSRVLTDAQRRVAWRMVQGSTNRQIAEDLGVSVATVNTHVVAILQRTGARDRHDVAALVEALPDGQV